MDILEKQQTVDAIKMVVKARWFYVSVIALQGAIAKLWFAGLPLAPNFLISLIVFIIFLFNFCFWLYLRRAPEKMSSSALKTIKLSQAPIEILGLSVILFFSGTVNKMLSMAYVIPIMVGSVLFKTKGTILTTFFIAFLYSGLVVMEYFGLLPGFFPEIASQSPTRPLKGELILVKGQLIGFNLYILAAAIYVGYLADLFNRREKNLREQRDELFAKTQALTKIKDELEESRSTLAIRVEARSRELKELAQSLEEKVKERTEELQKKMEDLEKFQKLAIGRELRMVELKKEIKRLEEELKAKDKSKNGK